MNKLYIISGCNGAGKTTASFTILPEILDCKEYVNADEIARGISPFQPEKVGLAAGRLMLMRIDTLLSSNINFAFETTLATRSYVSFIRRAKKLNYEVVCLFFWLETVDLAISRVKTRVKEGGHDIPEFIIRRRYNAGLKNFFTLFLTEVDNWIFVNNTGNKYEVISEGDSRSAKVFNSQIWNYLKKEYCG